MDEYITGSEGSVCQDPGVEDAASMQIKADIVRRTSAVMKEKDLTRQTASARTGIPRIALTAYPLPSAPAVPGRCAGEVRTRLKKHFPHGRSLRAGRKRTRKSH